MRHVQSLMSAFSQTPSHHDEVKDSNTSVFCSYCLTDTELNVLAPATDPNEFKQISFPTRALKYMLNEIQNAEKAGPAGPAGDGGIEADDGVGRRRLG
jgi:hypothetical protein